MADDKRFMLAIVLSIGVLLIWQLFFGLPAVEEERARQQEIATADQTADPTAPQLDATVPQPGAASIPQPGDATIPQMDARPDAGVPGAAQPREALIAANPRVDIESPRLSGSISLIGARFDDLQLKDYREEIDPESPQIVLLSPEGAEGGYFADFSWTAQANSSVAVPDPSTRWRPLSTGSLTPDNPLRLEWDNGQGLTFKRTIEIDQDYLFTVTQSVENTGNQSATLFPWGRIKRFGTPSTSGFFILHEGLLGVFNSTLNEVGYDDAQEEGEITEQSTGGWVGVTDKYWMTALAPNQSKEIKGRFWGTTSGDVEVYQADFLVPEGQVVQPGQTVSSTTHFFAGAKKVSIIDGYMEEYGIDRFDLAIDWGWLFFLTKPFFQALDFFGKLLGNFGLAILLLTVLIKLVFFPLANKSYAAMSKMKKLQPKMTQLRERYADDKVKQQQELMELYKREKVNPAAGCLPVVIQIPVFFALYKVLFVTIEMRQAPFFGWIQDLSAPDPTSLFNLFGLIPWDPPSILMIGIWPVIMGLTMFLQTKLNPAPADPVQEKIFLFMPLFFTYLLAQFPAGLVIYWTWNNLLSILQQYVIMRRMGVEVNLVENFKLPSWLTGATASLSGGGAKDSKDKADKDKSES